MLLTSLDAAGKVDEKDKLGKIAFISMLNYFLIIGAVNMTLQIIRIQKDVGQIVKLVSACLKNLSAFLVFFFSWVTIFSILHRVLGND